MINMDDIRQIQSSVSALLNKYKDGYSRLKDEPYDDTQAIWCKGWLGPFEPDFMDELALGNVHPGRQVLTSVPRKKEYVSVHHFHDGLPVRSFFIGKAGEIIADKIFITNDNSITGIAYDKNWDVFMITEEIRDDRGRPVSYTVYHHDSDGGGIYTPERSPKFTIKYTSYTYDEQDRIVSAVFLNGLTPDSGDLEKGWLINGSEEMISEHFFTYTTDGLRFSRDDYSEQLEKIRYDGEKAWKYPSWLLKRYQKLGIKYFG